MSESTKVSGTHVLKPVGIILIAATVITGGLYFALSNAGVGPARNNPDWLPKELTKQLSFQAAVNEEKIFMRFEWEQPDPGGWYHDMIVYKDGEWQRFVEPDPWVSEKDEGHTGFYEDRLSFLLDDGSVRGFQNFGGWLTAHRDGMRSLPGEVDRDDVVEHPHLGIKLERNDVRKYIPHSRKGEWWEGSWDEILSEEVLKRMKEAGVFLELPMWRAHRSNPMGYGTNHHVLDYRHGNEGRHTFGTIDWEPDEGPEYMFDPEVVENGALNLEKIYEDPTAYKQDLPFAERENWLGSNEPYYLHEEWMVPFDPDVAEWEGAVIPRRPLREPQGSAGSWKAQGHWENGRWKVEMWRELDTGYGDDTRLEHGGIYDWAPAVHHGFNQRWHWVGYPYRLGIGVGTEETGIDPVRFVEAAGFEGERPDWNEFTEKEILLIYPGLIDWKWLTGRKHPGYKEVREDIISIWDIHSDPKQTMLASLLPEAPVRALNWPLVFIALVFALGGVYFIIINGLLIWRKL